MSKLNDLLKTDSEIEIHKQVILNILCTQNAISEKMNEVFKLYDISMEQFNVLRILRGQKGVPTNMFNIQERMIARTSNTTRLVDKLLLKELVTRNVCPDNRRKIEVLITNKGLELLDKMDPIIENNEKCIVDNLSETEQKILVSLLEKLR